MFAGAPTGPGLARPGPPSPTGLGLPGLNIFSLLQETKQSSPAKPGQSPTGLACRSTIEDLSSDALYHYAMVEENSWLDVALPSEEAVVRSGIKNEKEKESVSISFDQPIKEENRAADASTAVNSWIFLLLLLFDQRRYQL